jgi:hypothetical protein
MGFYLRVKGQPFVLYRGQKVEEKTKATWYASSYAAETMLLRWEKAHPGQRLEIRNWETDDLIDKTTPRLRTKPESWR